MPQWRLRNPLNSIRPIEKVKPEINGITGLTVFSKNSLSSHATYIDIALGDKEGRLSRNKLATRGIDSLNARKCH